MKYVMTDVEADLHKMIEQEGLKSTVSTLIRSLIEFAHQASDMGLKESAKKALHVSDMLKEVRDKIED